MSSLGAGGVAAVARWIVLVLVTITAIVWIGRGPASFAAEAQQRLGRLGVFQQTEEPVTCRSLDRSYVQLDASLGGDLTPGRVLSLNDGTLAVLIVVTEVDDSGSAAAIDFAASVRISALIVRSGPAHDVRRFDPPVRNGANVRGPKGGLIDGLSFCYQIAFPPPPQAAQPTSTVERPDVTPTATELTLDLSGEQTAVARAAEIEATATAAAESAANDLATAQARAAEIAATVTAIASQAAVSDARASEIAATATAAAEDARSTAAANQTAVAASDAAMATAQANAAAAEATASALQATLAAPTSTPTPVPPTPTPTPVPPTETATPEPTATPVPTTLVYETAGENPFADWQPAEGWTLSGGVARTDGSGSTNWLIVPLPPGVGQDVIVEARVVITGGDICPRNFGAGVRISESGYLAGGIEWACDPQMVYWLGSQPVVERALPDGIDIGRGEHTLRIEAVGDQVSISLDGTEVIAEGIQNGPAGNLIAFWSDGVALELHSVKVYEVSG